MCNNPPYLCNIKSHKKQKAMSRLFQVGDKVVAVVDDKEFMGTLEPHKGISGRYTLRMPVPEEFESTGFLSFTEEGKYYHSDTVASLRLVSAVDASPHQPLPKAAQDFLEQHQGDATAALLAALELAGVVSPTLGGLSVADAIDLNRIEPFELAGSNAPKGFSTRALVVVNATAVLVEHNGKQLIVFKKN